MSPKTIFSYPVVEIDMPEMKDGFIIFGDWSNLSAVKNIAPARNRVQKDLIEMIAVNSAFEAYEVGRVYDIFKSFDLLVLGCEYAQSAGMADLEAACLAVLKSMRSKP